MKAQRIIWRFERNGDTHGFIGGLRTHRAFVIRPSKSRNKKFVGGMELLGAMVPAELTAARYPDTQCAITAGEWFFESYLRAIAEQFPETLTDHLIASGHLAKRMQSQA